MALPNKPQIAKPQPAAPKADMAESIAIATRSLKGMVTIAEELVALMEKEVGLIENRKIPEHAELLKRKQRLAIDYRASVKTLTLQPEILKQIPETLRVKAKVAVQKLNEVSDRNAKILRAAITALQRLIQSIIAIVKDEVLPKNSYTNHQAAGRMMGTYSPTCKPVTVNRTA